MRYPLIGITSSIDKEEKQQYLIREYMKAVAGAGGVPVLVSYDMSAEELEELARRIDGLLLAGGNDIGSELYGQPPVVALGQVDPLRDRTETALIKSVFAAKKPIFGICRGIQMLNAAFGGSLYQDLPTQYTAPDGAPPMAHQQSRPGAYASHGVSVARGSLLFEIVGQERLEVNSLHHQAVKEAAPGFAVSAAAGDGVTEALERRDYPFLLGVQWHPERMYHTDAVSRRLFEAFVDAAGK